MPTSLHSLAIGEVNMDSFSNTHTNWVADLPQTLARLGVMPRAFEKPIDLISFARFLPPNLTELALKAKLESTSFGDWSSLDRNIWPSTLVHLSLTNLYFEPSIIFNLPQTLTRLQLWFSYDDESTETLELSTFPPALTSLNLTIPGDASIGFSAGKLKLATLILNFHNEYLYDVSISKIKESFPDSLTHLEMLNFALELPIEGHSIVHLLPNLQHFRVASIAGECFELLPRGLRSLNIDFIDLSEAKPLVFMDLPPFLTVLTFQGYVKALGLTKTYPILEEDFGALTCLRSFSCLIKAPSKLLRKLPSSITYLQLKVEKWEDDDLLFLPPRLEQLHTELTPALIKCMPLKSLAEVKLLNRLAEDDLTPLVERVLEAAKNQ